MNEQNIPQVKARYPKNPIKVVYTPYRVNRITANNELIMSAIRELTFEEAHMVAGGNGTLDSVVDTGAAGAFTAVGIAVCWFWKKLPADSAWMH